MAIVVEREERSNSKVVKGVIWGMIVLIIAAAIYYIFFKRPELVEIPVPQNFKSTEELSKVRLSPEEVVTNPAFQLLRPYITPLVPPPSGKANPFLSG